MKQQNDEGPAFPTSGNIHGTRGMSLRDYFAAKALPGLMGRGWRDPTTGGTPENIMEIWARSSYAMADAMLKARKGD